MVLLVLPLLLVMWAPVAMATPLANHSATASAVRNDNARRVAALSTANPHAQFSLATPWANMTREEFARMHGLIVVGGAGAGTDPGLPCQFTGKGTVPVLVPTAAALPGGLDWVARGATVGVKNQGKCGSCWAHGTTAVVESRMKLETGKITPLSEQFLLDCDGARVCGGCCGGLAERALQWLAGDAGPGFPYEGRGIASEADYPYTSASGVDPTKGRCNHSAPLVAKLAGFGVLKNPVTAARVTSAVTQYGVLATSMDAHALQFYKSGIITSAADCSSSDHVVAIVGYGTEGGVPYYKVRNSYGTQFGEDGYFRISKAAAEGCGMFSCVVAGTGSG